MRKMTEIDLKEYTLRRYEHFNKRLLERYSMSLSLDEYISLGNMPFNLIYVLSACKRFGIVNIKGINVYAILDKRIKSYATCLIENGGYPLPVGARQLGLSREDFNYNLNKVYEEVKEMNAYLNSIGNDTRRFFTEKVFDVPDWMYSAAHYINYPNRCHPLQKIVYHLFAPTHTSTVRQ